MNAESDRNRVRLFEPVPGFFLGLSNRCRRHRCVGGLDMAAGLEPPPELGVMNQVDLQRLRIGQDGADREVPGLEILTGELGRLPREFEKQLGIYRNAEHEPGRNEACDDGRTV